MVSLSPQVQERYGHDTSLVPMEYSAEFENPCSDAGW